MTTRIKPVLLSAPQAARILEVDVRTVQRLAEQGTLEHAFKGDGPTGAYVFNLRAVTNLRSLRRKEAA